MVLTFMLALMAFSNQSKAQMIVEAPTLEVLQTTLNQLIGTQTTIQKLQESARWSSDFAKGMKTVKQIEQIIELIACERAMFELYMGLVDPSNCIGNLNLNFILVDMNLSFDWYIIAIGKVIGMAGSERVHNLETALTYLKEGHEKMQKFMTMTDIEVENRMNRIVNQKDYGQGMGLNVFTVEGANL